MPRDPLALVLGKLRGVQVSGGQHQACCPAHDDRTPSLTIACGRKGQVILTCHRGCTFQAILGALQLATSDLYPDAGRGSGRTNDGGPRQEIVATYDYTDQAGALLF